MEEEVTPAQAGLIKGLLAQIRVSTPMWAEASSKEQASRVINALKGMVDIQRMIDSRIVDCGRTIMHVSLLCEQEEIPSMRAINQQKQELLAFLPDPNYRPKLVGPATDSQLLAIIKLIGRKADKLTEQEMANLRQKLADKPTKEWADRAIKKLISIS